MTHKLSSEDIKEMIVMNTTGFKLGFKQEKINTLILGDVLEMAYNYSLLEEAHKALDEVFPNPEKVVESYLTYIDRKEGKLYDN